MSNTAVPFVKVRIPAKVNLFLQVGPVRPDGFHELVTVFQAVSLFDEVTARPADRFEVTVSGVGADNVPTDERNLAWRAAELLASEFGDRASRPPLAAHIHIDKHIPVAGGMAGGSADAAGALVACAQLWGIDLTDIELHGLAARLGSDVNFCLIGGTAIGRGRGEQLTPLATSGMYHWVFATADGGISAAAAYTELDRLRAAGLAFPPQDYETELAMIPGALQRSDLSLVQALFWNDLEAAAISLMPKLQDILDAGSQLGAIGYVSGSGPTCAFLVHTAEGAEALAVYLRASGTCKDAFVATAPIPGPIPLAPEPAAT